ncbi:MAG: dihydropteroate synthase [Chloroflexota bacterium]
MGRPMFEWGVRTYVMGIINMTPDSFAGDGLGTNVEAALRRAREMVAAGADLLDVGGESTRPGAEPVPAEEEMYRVLPAIEGLARNLDCPISVDTYKAEVAEAAVWAGARMINDVWGLRMDPRIAEVAARTGAYLVITHNSRPAPTAAWDYAPVEGGLMDRIVAGLRQAINLAVRAGVPPERIIVDPGLGFGKSWQENLLILRHLGRLRELGRPVLIGPSRKSFIGRVLGVEVQERLEGTAAAVAIGIANGADLVRVHDVGPMVRVARMADAIVRWRLEG